MLLWVHIALKAMEQGTCPGLKAVLDDASAKVLRARCSMIKSFTTLAEALEWAFQFFHCNRLELKRSGTRSKNRLAKPAAEGENPRNGFAGILGCPDPAGQVFDDGDFHHG